MAADDERVTFEGLLAERVRDGEQGAFAAKVGVTQSTVSRWIDGKSLPAAVRVPILAEQLEVPEIQLVQLIHEARRRTMTMPERMTALEDEIADLRDLVIDLADRLESA